VRAIADNTDTVEALGQPTRLGTSTPAASRWGRGVGAIAGVCAGGARVRHEAREEEAVVRACVWRSCLAGSVHS